MVAADEEIEVGQNGPEFRLWLATEAKRQGEIRLIAQASAIAAMEARATAILQWSVGIAAALLAVVRDDVSQGKFVPYAATLVFLGLSALLCIAALWPKDWHPPGYDFSTLKRRGVQTELEISESTALGYAEGILKNDKTATRFCRLLRLAWLFFALAPAAGMCGILWNQGLIGGLGRGAGG